jgi:hypothetical protein
MMASPSMQRVATLVSAQLEAGSHTIHWSPSDDAGRPLTTGVYRVIIELDREWLAWHDVLVYRSQEELPADLRAYVRSW